MRAILLGDCRKNLWQEWSGQRWLAMDKRAQNRYHYANLLVAVLFEHDATLGAPMAYNVIVDAARRSRRLCRVAARRTGIVEWRILVFRVLLLLGRRLWRPCSGVLNSAVRYRLRVHSERTNFAQSLPLRDVRIVFIDQQTSAVLVAWFGRFKLVGDGPHYVAGGVQQLMAVGR